ncbi:hypothetical protein Pcinc_039373 [Petrolisthes cinctipes]|uniref:Guanylate cyclase n=1 Tax=Petrolisthes cinctipes TaxID=88211 RepID=A0AAE1EJ86_PETCI|nr:hypothetical protein Pcinc_039373 [Petrolisthes cinctipes]
MRRGRCSPTHDASLREERVVGRLVYDSVSLLSHILRTNVGTVRLRKKSSSTTTTTTTTTNNNNNNNNNTTSEEPPRTRKVRPGDDIEPRRSGRSLSSLLHHTWDREGFNNLAGRETREAGEHRDREAERERLYFEVKTLNAARAGREFERRLESIIGSRGIAGPGAEHHHHHHHQHLSSAHHNRSRLLEVRVTRPTHFPGMRGRGLVDTTGRRDFDFVLLDWRPLTGLLAPVLTLAPAPLDSSNMGSVVVVYKAEVDWAHDTPVEPDRDCGPAAFCGYEVAGVRLAPRYVVLIILCLLFLLAGCCGCTAVLRKRLRQKEMSRGPYKILLTSSDLTLSSRPENAPRKPGSGAPGDRPDLLRGSLSSPQRPTPHDSLLSTASHAAGRDADESKAKYNGDFVHVKYFYSHSGSFEVKNRTMTLLKQMRDLRHENVNGFLGMLCDQLRPGLVFEYCSRRSLENIIKQEDIKLDWSFRLSLLTDLVRGMRYLHGSLLRHHGRLSSRNCVIDARWVLKITDYGLPGIHEYQNLSRPNRPLRDLLWKAPELLRDESLMQKGTQSGDIFSFAIIMQEVVVRGAPYCMIQLTTQEILARLKKPPPMIRPSVSKGAAPPDVINIMKQCWAELPEMRPDFNQINDLFKKLNQGRRLNIVDTMFHMLEKYSSNLEELIKDRTEQLDIEKKKTEQLLNRMLPSSVADQLKLGMPVAPEEFEEVTIYFSDIVGFTSISAYSTPFEVVDLLNDLYTAFDATINHYNVYKVETIGDAYMVVGGAPKKIDDHASQIATMALDLLHLSGKFKIRHLHNISLMLRIGMHTGPCCAGVVGMTMPRYCLFGDTVNTASRMESTGSAWRIHVSQKTWSVLQEEGGYHLEYRGFTKLKGKGEMETYWLLGKNGFKKELPIPPEFGSVCFVAAQRLDEELIRQGRQHYMSRRDSGVESLITAKGFSSIQAAKMQSDPIEGVFLEGGEEWAATSCSTGNSLMTPPTGLGHMDTQLDADLSPLGEDDQLPNFVSKTETINDRTSSENLCTVVKEGRKNSKDKGNSTKSSSKSDCVQNKSQSTVPKVMRDSGVVPRKKSRERCDIHQMDKQTSGVSKSTVPSEGAIRENHIGIGSEIELDTSYYCDVTLRNHTSAEGAHLLMSKSNSVRRSHPPSEDTDEVTARTSSVSLGPRQEFHRGPIISRTASPPLLCHNKVFPQYGTAASPVRECTRSSITSPAGSWGQGPRMPWQQQQHQEVVGTRPTTLQGVTIEYQVHSNPHDLPSPTESTML